jgi:hypothetical protein
MAAGDIAPQLAKIRRLSLENIEEHSMDIATGAEDTWRKAFGVT